MQGLLGLRVKWRRRLQGLLGLMVKWRPHLSYCLGVGSAELMGEWVALRSQQEEGCGMQGGVWMLQKQRPPPLRLTTLWWWQVVQEREAGALCASCWGECVGQ